MAHASTFTINELPLTITTALKVDSGGYDIYFSVEVSIFCRDKSYLLTTYNAPRASVSDKRIYFTAQDSLQKFANAASRVVVSRLIENGLFSEETRNVAETVTRIQLFDAINEELPKL